MARVWILVGAVWAAAVGLYLTVAGESAVTGPVLDIPWWVIALGFAFAEVHVVHATFRGEAHTLSLSEVPLVLGIVALSADELIAAQLLGVGAALVIHRRQPAIKLAFNLGQLALGTMAALTVLRALATPSLEAPSGWGAMMAATGAASALSVLLIFAAISLVQSSADFRQLAFEARLGFTVTIANTSLGVAGVVLVTHSPSAAWLLIVPAATLFFGYRAYIAERRRREKLDFLHSCTRRMDEDGDVDRALIGVLDEARRMFQASLSKVVLFSSIDDELALSATAGPGPLRTFGSVDLTRDEHAWVELARGGAALRGDGELPDDVQEAIVAPLPGEDGPVGVLLVGGRLGDVGGFEPEDVTLLDTLACHIAMALENGRLEKSVSQLAEVSEQHRFMAFHDPLTGLGNRALFAARLERALTRARKDERGIAVLFCDLDDFKVVNDSLGHVAGDVLLVEVAKRVKQCLRSGDLAARLGGDEFALLLEGVSAATDAALVAGRILDRLRTPVLVHDKEVFPHASVGITIVRPGDGVGVDEILRNADAAMYEAKANGKDCYRFYEASMHAAALERLELRGEISRALERGEFVLHFQPVVDLQTELVVGVEALTRWNHPTRGLLGPDRFIPLAEQTGQIIALGRWVAREALDHAARWARSFSRPVDMSVNVSARQLQDPSFPDELRAIIAQAGVDPSTVVLEITESVLVADVEQTAERLHELKEIGVRLAVDDFGTGYSALNYLSRFPLDIIKVDRSFVAEIGEPGAGGALAEAIVNLGRTLGVAMLAEGIERPDQLVDLRSWGCQLGQGYHLGRPVPAEAVERMLSGRFRLKQAYAESGAQAS